MNESFSKRHGYRSASEAPISVRADAPHDLRGVLVQIAYECGYRPRTLRLLVCRTLRKRPDENNWTEYPNIDSEVRSLIDDCEWYRVYDVIESLASSMRGTPTFQKFESELNDYFIENGIGWKLVNSQIEVRGTENFERSVGEAENQLQTSGFATARSELHEALRDLSRRPVADVTGAIQHSMAALECVARIVCGDEKANLGEIMKRYGELIPRPLDQAVVKTWGFASENARHIREGREPTFEEAELVVGMVAAVATYLSRKHTP